MHERKAERGGGEADAGAARADGRRPAESAPALVASNLTDLQALAGNRTVCRVVQPKLAVGRADDPLELEADEVARQVVRGILRRSRAGAGADDTDGPTKAGVAVMRRAASDPASAEGGAISADSEAAIRGAQRSGTGLDPHVRPQLEEHFGASFDSVRVHTDGAADRLSREFGATAFTTGRDIFFRDGAYNPGRPDGLELIAHELTHVVQQGGAPAVRRKKGKGDKAPLLSSKARSDDDFDDDSDDLEGTPEGGYGELIDEDERVPAKDPVTIGASALVNATDDDIKAVAKAFVDYTKKFEVEGEHGSAAASVDAHAEASATASLSKEGKDLLEGLTYLAQAGALAEATLELTAEAAAKLPYGVSLEAEAKLKLFATASAKASAKLSVGLLSGFVASASVKGRVGVGAEGSAKGTVKWGKAVEAAFEAKGKAFAGAEGKAQGLIQITKDGIAISGNVSGFAGAKASGSASHSFTIKGKELWRIDVKGEVSVGVGGSVGGSFTLDNGILKISVDLAGTLGIGGGGTGELTINYEAIGEAIALLVYEQYQKTQDPNRYQKLVDPTNVERPLTKDLQAYGIRKDSRMAAGKAEHYIKAEKVNKIVAKHVAKVKSYKGDPILDEVIRDAFKAAYGSRLKVLVVSEGEVRAFEAS